MLGRHFFFLHNVCEMTLVGLFKFNIKHEASVKQDFWANAIQRTNLGLGSFFKTHHNRVGFARARFPFSDGMETLPNAYSPVEFDTTREFSIWLVYMIERKDIVVALGFYASKASNLATLRVVQSALESLPPDEEEEEDSIPEQVEEEEEEEEQVEEEEEEEEDVESQVFYIANVHHAIRPKAVDSALLETFALQRVRLLKSALRHAQLVQTGRSDFAISRGKLVSYSRNVFSPRNPLAFDLDVSSFHLVCMAVAQLSDKNVREWVAAERFLFKCRVFGQDLDLLCEKNGLDSTDYASHPARKVTRALEHEIERRRGEDSSKRSADTTAILESIKIAYRLYF